MTGIDFDVSEYAADNPWCECWKYATNPIREWCWQYQCLMPHHRRVTAHHIAHIIGGTSGRKHYLANVLHLNSALHAWCDSHGRAGRVLMMYAKWKKGEHDFDLWGRLLTECNNVFGWLDEDKCRDQCGVLGLEELRQQLVAAEFGHGIE